MEREHPGREGVPGVDSIVAGLTEPQRQAVLHTEGPLLVLAGPGSGKTRVITRRIAYLIACGIPAWQILALTFTNKAAGEMRERVLHLLGEGAASRGLTVTTFHALCARLLRRYADIAGIPGLKPDFAIFDTADQMAVMKKVIAELGLSTQNFPPRSVLSHISNAKNQLLDAATFAQRADDFSTRNVAKIYTAYERALRQAGGVDFDDLLLLTAMMLRDNRQVREDCRSRWSYLLIDEYQDTNRAQFVIASLLAGDKPAEQSGAAPPPPPPPPNICVVGDPDQSIYAWRGADISNILEFEDQYPSASVITLGENFRSTKAILGTADTLIRRNTRRKHKDLYTSRSDGERVEVILCRDEHHEARTVLDWLRDRHGEDTGHQASGTGGSTASTTSAQSPVPSACSWKDMAVFYRTNALSRVIEDELRGAGIPYVIARGTAFYQREEIKHAIAYLRVVANPADSVSLGRIINMPTRGIGDTTWDRIEAAAGALGITVLEALRRAAAGALGPVGGELSSRAVNAIRKFVAMVDGWTGAGSFLGSDVPASLADLVGRVVRESGLEGMYKAGGTDTDQERLENLDELVTSAAEFESGFDPAADPATELASLPALPLPENRDTLEAANPGARDLPMPPLLALLRAYLERVTLVADADAVDPAQGAVTLMTLHAAKGLEFRAVAMIGLEEGMLPHMRAQEESSDMEEERRLCFVGITRAMERLLITSARYRAVRGMEQRTIPSRFLDEIQGPLVAVTDRSDPMEWEDESDRRGGGRAGGVSSTPAWGATMNRPSPAAAAAPRSPGLPVGALVRHPQFGVGRVQSVTPGGNARAQIKFRDAGLKTIVLGYARLEIVAGPDS